MRVQYARSHSQQMFVCSFSSVWDCSKFVHSFFWFFEVPRTQKWLGSGFLLESKLWASRHHTGLLGIPGNFHQARNHKNEDCAIFWKVRVRKISSPWTLIFLWSLWPFQFFVLRANMYLQTPIAFCFCNLSPSSPYSPYKSISKSLPWPHATKTRGVDVESLPDTCTKNSRWTSS